MGAVDVAERLDVLRTQQGRALIDSLMPYDPATALGRLESARRDPRWAGRAEVVAAAATQARLRTRAVKRFPGPTRWWTADGLEQATRPVVAARHARRFVEAGVTQVADLGCGVGGDALAMAAADLSVTAVDRDPEALWALRATAADLGLSVATLCGDVRRMPGPWADPARAGDPTDTATRPDATSPGTTRPGATSPEGMPPDPSGPGDPGDPAQAFGCFVDPARRTGAGRALDPQRWSPPWSWVRELAQRVPATGAKVAPGIDHDHLPPEVQSEWISVEGDLVEAGVWWGPLRHGEVRRQATVLRAECEPAQLDDADGIPGPAIGPLGPWLVEPDPAVIRAGLVSVFAEQIGGRLLDPRIAYIVAEQRPEVGAFGATFAVGEEVPFARKAMRTWLRTRGYGDVVLKKRGINVVPEQLRAELRLSGDGPTATLVLTRTDHGGPMAVLVERVGRSDLDDVDR